MGCVMLHTNQHPDQSCSRTESLLHRIMAECEGFGARYQYSPRMMFAGAVFTAIRLSRSSLYSVMGSLQLL
jgi:hypothetical protein